MSPEEENTLEREILRFVLEDLDFRCLISRLAIVKGPSQSGEEPLERDGENKKGKKIKAVALPASPRLVQSLFVAYFVGTVSQSGRVACLVVARVFAPTPGQRRGTPNNCSI